MFWLPLLVSFTDITLRTVLQETISSQTLVIISFVILLVLYGLSYHLLWKWVLKKYDVETSKLLELGTLTILFSDLVIYALLFQTGNTMSNLTWLGFYLVLIAQFYMLGKRSIKQLAI